MIEFGLGAWNLWICSFSSFRSTTSKDIVLLQILLLLPRGVPVLVNDSVWYLSLQLLLLLVVSSNLILVVLNLSNASRSVHLLGCRVLLYLRRPHHTMRLVVGLLLLALLLHLER